MNINDNELIVNKEDDFMRTIEKIIRTNTYDRDKFIKMQNDKLANLRAISNINDATQKAKAKQKVIEDLQHIGVLDENGEIAKPYRIED